MINSLGFESDSQPPKDPEEYHATINIVCSRHPESTEYKSFSFVRNPWDRFVSVYKDGITNQVLSNWSRGMLQYENFTEFANNFEKSKWADEVHFLPCSDFLKIDGEISVDHIGRFENLHHDFLEITKKVLGRGMNIKHHNNKTRRTKDYRVYYNKETADIVRRAYKEDIERFNYEY